MRAWSFFLFVLLPQLGFSQACLNANSTIDAACNCQAKNNCYKLFSSEYLQSLKKASSTGPKMIKAIVNNQKATSAAFNKIMSNLPVTPQDLEAVRKEAATLNKINQENLSLLNSTRAKKGKAPLKPDKDAQKFNKQFLSSLPADLQKKLTKNSSPLSGGKLTPSAAAANLSDESSKESEDTFTMETMAESSPEDQLVDETNSLDGTGPSERQTDFDYTTEICEEKSRPIFNLISNRYQQVLLKKESLHYHIDSDKERSLKSEIKEDIRKMVDLRGKNF